VDVMLQLTAPLRNFLKGDYSKVYDINSNINIMTMLLTID